MRKKPDERVEPGRFRHGEYGSEPGELNGAFKIQHEGIALFVIATPGDREYPWEHVSVSTKDRTPTWDEMCFIKSLFWEDEEAVVQFHPPKSQYVNHHPFCLHMWRPRRWIDRIRMPPSILIGPKNEPQQSSG